MAPAHAQAVVLERCLGRSGELVLQRRGDHLEVICNGTFLVSTENETSSRALVAAAAKYLPRRPLDVLVGGLGVGHALDETLQLEGVASVTVAELEPAIVRWFKEYCGERAARALADSRVRIVVADVLDVLRDGRGRYDLVALDTDNGPDWLVREPNAALYEEVGIGLAHDALRPGGVATFWSTGRMGDFEDLLKRRFAGVMREPARDIVQGRALDYIMYVAVRAAA